MKRQNLRRRNSARCPRSFLSLPLPLNLPLQLAWRHVESPLFLLFEFDVRHVQHESSWSAGLRLAHLKTLPPLTFRCPSCAAAITPCQRLEGDSASSSTAYLAFVVPA